MGRRTWWYQMRIVRWACVGLLMAPCGLAQAQAAPQPQVPSAGVRLERMNPQFSLPSDTRARLGYLPPVQPIPPAPDSAIYREGVTPDPSNGQPVRLPRPDCTKLTGEPAKACAIATAAHDACSGTLGRDLRDCLRRQPKPPAQNDCARAQPGYALAHCLWQNAMLRACHDKRAEASTECVARWQAAAPADIDVRAPSRLPIPPARLAKGAR